MYFHPLFLNNGILNQRNNLYTFLKVSVVAILDSLLTEDFENNFFINISAAKQSSLLILVAIPIFLMGKESNRIK